MKTLKFSFFFSRLTYKKSFLIILFLTTTINFLSSQCANGYVQVGSAIGISSLTEAINGGHLQVNSGGSIVGNICINGDFTIDLGYPWQNCNLLFMNGSKLLKNGPSGNSFNNCTFDGVGYTEIKLSGTGSGSVSYFLFRNCQISNITKMLGEHNGGFTFDVGCTISDVSIIQAKNDGFVAFAGSSIINSPIKIENSLFGDFGQNNFVASGGNSSYSVLLENQSAFIGGNGSTYSNAGNSSIICNNCSPSSIENANFNNSYRGVLIENSPFGFDINDCNFGMLWYGIKASNSHNITIKNCESTNSLVNFFGSNLSSHQYIINNTLADFDRIDFSSSFFTYVAMNPKIGSIDSRFGEIMYINKNQINGAVRINDFSNAYISENSLRNIDEVESFNTYYNCNHISYSMDISGTPFLEIGENKFEGGEGITFECSFNDQIDKGNKFRNGAEVVGKADYNEGTFFVLNTPEEFPSHDPDKIMNNNGGTRSFCTPGIQDNTDNEIICSEKNKIYLKKLIVKLLQCRNSELSLSGACHKNMRLVNKILRLCPNLKEDLQIKSLLQNSLPKEVSELPDLSNLISLNKLNILPNTNESFINGMQNVSLESIGQIDSLFSFYISNKLYWKNEIEKREIKINQSLSELSDITSNELSINNYKNALIWYLEYCRDLNCTEYRKNEIKNLAETCDDQNSPGQIIAKELCEILKINYSSQNCLAERNSLIKHEFEPSVYPNPTTGLLYLNNALSKNVEITNLNGQLIYKEDNIKSEFIDLSLSTNGIYIVKISGTEDSKSFKIIKID